MALGVYRDLPDSERKVWATLVERLGDKFNPRERTELDKLQFQNRTRQVGESLLELATSLRALATRAYPNVNSEARDELSRDRFLAVLGSDIRLRVRQERPKTLEAAVSLALELEAIGQVEAANQVCRVSADDELLQPIKTSDACVVTQEHHKMEQMMNMVMQTMDAVRDVCESLKNVAGTIQTMKQCQRGREIKCYQCGELGHVRAKCGSVDPYSAVFVEGKLWDEPIDLLIDTGAAVSLIDEKVWQRASNGKLQPTNRSVINASGDHMTVLGTVSVPVRIGSYFVTQEMIVAKGLTQMCLIGTDFLRRNKCDVLLSKGIMRVGEGEVPLNKTQGETQPGVCRVTLKETLVIPSGHEVVLQAAVSADMGMGVLETNSHLSEKHGIFAARVVVSSKDKAIPVRLLNPHPHPVTLYSGTNIGSLMPCVIAGTVGTGDKTTRDEKASSLFDLDSAKLSLTQHTDIRLLQDADEAIGHIAQLKREEKERPTACEASSRGESYMSLWAQWKRLEVHRGLLYRRWLEENKPDILQLCMGSAYKVGDRVWLHQPAVRKGTSPKLHRAWDGPYIVKTIISDVVYRIQRESPKRKRMIVHFNRLKPCSSVLREPTSTTDREGTDVSENLSPEKDLGPSLLPRSSSLDFSNEDETKTNSPELFVVPKIIPERRYPARQRKPTGYYLDSEECGVKVIPLEMTPVTPAPSELTNNGVDPTDPDLLNDRLLEHRFPQLLDNPHDITAIMVDYVSSGLAICFKYEGIVCLVADTGRYDEEARVLTCYHLRLHRSYKRYVENALDEMTRKRESSLRQHSFFQLRVHLRRGIDLVARDKGGEFPPASSHLATTLILYDRRV
uniref:(California timema) hypothetical protein n=1 Tax=Timema californicum TaxID=61474 RepID=A0A7R9J1C1_TIMCA|nr:unnamed protein product [Timema californicum]